MTGNNSELDVYSGADVYYLARHSDRSMFLQYAKIGNNRVLQSPHIYHYQVRSRQQIYNDIYVIYFLKVMHVAMANTRLV